MCEMSEMSSLSSRCSHLHPCNSRRAPSSGTGGALILSRFLSDSQKKDFKSRLQDADQHALVRTVSTEL